MSEKRFGRILGLGVERVAVGRLRLSERNPRRGDLEAIRASLEAHGQYRSLIVNRRSLEVLCGNQTLRAARELGWSEVGVQFVDVDEEQALRILLVDNRSSDLAGYDEAELARILSDLTTLEGTGYDEVALAALLNDLEADLPAVEDEIPPVPAAAETQPGELITLGHHRLVCGDARQTDVYAQLMDGEVTECMFVDPPYGANYSGKTAERLTILNDDPSRLHALLTEAFACVDRVLSPGCPIYVAHPSGQQALTFMQAFAEVGWLHRQTLVWSKGQFVLGRSDYMYAHELILYGFRPGPGRLGRGGSSWFGGNRQGSVWEVPRPRAQREHPTAKPVELVAIALRNSSRRGAVVVDPFAGSGSTLIACERLGRCARLVELDPRYCDVVCARFERLTGVKPVRHGVV